MSNRLHWIDISKGMLILFVVFQHLPVISDAAGVEHIGVGKLGHLSFLFTCFYMQAFFILTGYCSNFEKPFTVFLKSSFKSIMIPAIFFSILYHMSLALLYLDFSYVEQMTSLNFLMNGCSKFWFLNALFLLRILYWFRVRYIKNDLTGGGIFLILLVLGMMMFSEFRNSGDNGIFSKNYFYYMNALVNGLFIWFGDLLKKYKVQKKWLIISGFWFLILVITFKVLKWNIPSSLYQPSMGISDIPLHIVFVVLGSFGIYGLAMKINCNSFLEYLGKNSLIIYTTHFVVVRYVYCFTSNFLQISPSIITGLIYDIWVYLLSVIICCAIIKLFALKHLRLCTGKFN